MIRATWVALVVVPLLTGCTDPTVPDEALVDVSLTSSKSEIAIGEATELRALARNSTDRPLTIQLGGCFLVIEMVAADGKRFVESTVCNDIEFSQVLEPGDSLYRTVSFDGTGWLTLDGPTIPAPGDYELRAGLSIRFAHVSESVALRIAAPTGSLLLEPTLQ